MGHRLAETPLGSLSRFYGAPNLLSPPCSKVTKIVNKSYPRQVNPLNVQWKQKVWYVKHKNAHVKVYKNNPYEP